MNAISHYLIRLSIFEKLKERCIILSRTKDEIRTGAQVFGTAAIILSNVAETALKTDNQIEKQTMAQNIIPCIVLKAFSCELYLKFLSQNNSIKNVHKLDELYDNLSENDRNTIKKSVMVQLGECDETLFRTGLNNITNAFVDWRYFYENPRSINLEFLNCLFNALLELCKKYKTI